MRYVIIRDDDTNALTPLECLERLYRPFLERGLPINLAVIPEVSATAKMGYGKPETFVAPYDRLSRAAFLQVSSHFRILSSAWYELGRLPLAWWPRYLLKKLRDTPHWQVGSRLLLAHPGCLLSYTRNFSEMLASIIARIQGQRLTV